MTAGNMTKLFKHIVLEWIPYNRSLKRQVPDKYLLGSASEIQ